MKNEHNAGEEYSRRTWENDKDNGHGVHGETLPEAGGVFICARHDHDEHDHDGNDEHAEGEEEEVEMAVVAFADASADPRAVVVHPFNADTTLAAVTGATGAIDVAGGAQFKFLGLLTGDCNIGDDIVVVDMLVFGDLDEALVDFVAVFLDKKCLTIFWMKPGSCTHRLRKVQKFKNCAMNSTYSAPK